MMKGRIYGKRASLKIGAFILLSKAIHIFCTPYARIQNNAPIDSPPEVRQAKAPELPKTTEN
ncbi:hypothetical protein A3H65_03450 [Candidatus Giovannonibacteria bacterium RIFCSPLOWO2_02_FULL_45_14]|nr:MAG: hypothetical protein A3H65_03450 [Candidatus Giovannonibacteria bacterium RIFCSPLOWO2_02_FULL_45_14]